MNLSTEQLKALRGGDAIPITVGHTHCVLIRKNVYERVKEVVQYDDSQWTDDEIEALGAQTFEQLDRPETIG